MDQVAREVTEAHAMVQVRHRRIAVAEAGVKSARDSFERNFHRIREGQGLPIEVLQAIQALDTTQREAVNAIADYYRPIPIAAGAQLAHPVASHLRPPRGLR